jgi:polar amino acid transport system substrate-binding protein
MWMKMSSIFLIFFICLCSNPDQELEVTENIQETDENTVHLATLTWLPYVGEEFANKGYVYQLVKEAYKAVGMKVDIQFYPFSRILRLAETGQIDGYFPEYYTPDYNSIFYFSDPFQGGDVGFLVNKDSNIQAKTQSNMHDFSEWKNYTFGVVRGYINTKNFDSTTYIQKEETGSDILNIKKLYFRRVDAIFVDVNVANYIIHKNSSKYPAMSEKLEFKEPALENKQLYVCFSIKSKKASYKLKKFNQGLNILKENGTLQKILQESNFKKGRYIPPAE